MVRKTITVVVRKTVTVVVRKTTTTSSGLLTPTTLLLILFLDHNDDYVVLWPIA